jgi:imidazolonepropionase-like amidohydrolase
MSARSDASRWLWIAFLTAPLLAAGSALAQGERPARGAAPAAAAEEKKDAAKDEKPAKEPDRFLAVSGATVHTITGPTLSGVTVLSKNGKVHAIGRDLAIPEGAERIDAVGLHLYPGLVAAVSAGLVGSGDPASSTDVYSLNVTLGLAGGLTTVATGNAAAKLSFGAVDALVLKENLFESISYSRSNPSGRRRFRESLERVRGYVRELEVFEDQQRRRDPDARKPDDRWIQGDYRRALRLIRKEAAARASAGSAQDLLELAELASHYGFRLVVEGAHEGWSVARELARAGVAAVITPRAQIDRDERSNRPNGSTIENARILHQHGVPFAIVPESTFISTGGLAGRDLLHLPMEAAFAVRGGLSDDAAERAITIDAARILGIDHRVGSIEIGKDADLIVTDGELLHYMTHVRWAIVNGRIAYDKAKDTLFEHIRPGGKLDAPPPKDHWPRGLGEEW